MGLNPLYFVDPMLCDRVKACIPLESVPSLCYGKIMGVGKEGHTTHYISKTRAVKIGSDASVCDLVIQGLRGGEENWSRVDDVHVILYWDSGISAEPTADRVETKPQASTLRPSRIAALKTLAASEATQLKKDKSREKTAKESKREARQRDQFLDREDVEFKSSAKVHVSSSSRLSRTRLAAALASFTPSFEDKVWQEIPSLELALSQTLGLPVVASPAEESCSSALSDPGPASKRKYEDMNDSLEPALAPPSIVASRIERDASVGSTDDSPPESNQNTPDEVDDLGAPLSDPVKGEDSGSDSSKGDLAVLADHEAVGVADTLFAMPGLVGLEDSQDSKTALRVDCEGSLNESSGGSATPEPRTKPWTTKMNWYLKVVGKSGIYLNSYYHPSCLSQGGHWQEISDLPSSRVPVREGDVLKIGDWEANFKFF
ncbi:hypothetical protein HDV03_001011 [Kappamyces sp. JEL0829]|nr:hypothetical protein HDV03_001011 [Kappamyces sp. JEL0829]